MINREEYLDDYGLQVDPLFDMVDKLQSEIEQLKKENEELKDAINTIGESALGGSGDHSSAPYDCEDIYKICCELTKDKE